jgi:Domain of unknown function (DUF5004)
MQKSFIHILLYSAFFVLIFSCKKSDDPVATASNIKGKWILTNIKSKTEFKGQKIEDINTDMNAQNLYYEFDGVNKYSSNVELSVGTFSKGSGINAGKYTLDKSVMTLFYTEKLISKEIGQQMQIKTLTDKELVIYVGKDELINSLKATAGLDLLTTTVLKLFLDTILQFEYTLTFKKG